MFRPVTNDSRRNKGRVEKYFHKHSDNKAEMSVSQPEPFPLYSAAEPPARYEQSNNLKEQCSSFNSLHINHLLDNRVVL